MQKHDVCLYLHATGAEVAEVLFHAEIDGVHWTGVVPWKTLSQADDVRKCVVADDAVLIKSERIIESVIYSPAPCGAISIVIMPAIARFGLHPEYSSFE